MEIEEDNKRRWLKTDLQRKIAGYASAFMTSLTAALVIMTGQIINDNEPPFEINAIRFGFQALFGAAVLLITRTDPRFPVQWRPLAVMVVATFALFGAGILFILSSWYLPVTVVHGIMEATVMVLAGVMACVRRKCHLDLPFGIIICTTGCLLLSQPSVIFNHLDNKQPAKLDLTNNETISNITSILEAIHNGNINGTNLIRVNSTGENVYSVLNNLGFQGLENYTGMSKSFNNTLEKLGLSKVVNLELLEDATNDYFVVAGNDTKPDCVKFNFCADKKIFDMEFNCTLNICRRMVESDPKWAMYGFLFVLGLGICLWQHAQFNVNYLVQYTPISALIFWLGIGASILAVPMTFIIETPHQISEPLNIFLVISFCLAFTLNTFFIMLTVTLIPLSHASMILPTALVYLYIFQKTFLRGIHPGPSNWLEKVGLFLVILGAIIPPTCDIYRERARQKKESRGILDDIMSDADEKGGCDFSSDDSFRMDYEKKKLVDGEKTPRYNSVQE